MIYVIIGVITLFEILLVWLLMYMDLDDYTDFGKDVIWVTNNREFNWFFTYFLTPHAIMYEHCCDDVNGVGLAILLFLLSLITLPATCLMSLIGGIALFIRFVWHWFRRAFARKEDYE